MLSTLSAIATALDWGEVAVGPRGWQHHDEYGVRITDHQIGAEDRQVYRLGDALALTRENTGGSAA